MINVSEKTFEALLAVVPDKKYAEWIDFVYPIFHKECPAIDESHIVEYVENCLKVPMFIHVMLKQSLKKTEQDISAFMSIDDFQKTMIEYMNLSCTDACDKNWRRFEAESSDNEILIYDDPCWTIGIPLTYKTKALMLDEEYDDKVYAELIFLLDALSSVELRFKNKKDASLSFTFVMDYRKVKIGKHYLHHLAGSMKNVSCSDESLFNSLSDYLHSCALASYLCSTLARIAEFWTSYVEDDLVPNYYGNFSNKYAKDIELIGNKAQETIKLKFKLPKSAEEYDSSSIGRLLDTLLTRAQVNELGKKLWKSFILWNDKPGNILVGTEELNTASSYMYAEVCDSIDELILDNPAADVEGAEEAALENEVYYIVKELRRDLYSDLWDQVGFEYHSGDNTVEFDLSELEDYANDSLNVVLDLIEAPQNFDVVLNDWANACAFNEKAFAKLSNIKLHPKVIKDRFNKFVKSKLN